MSQKKRVGLALGGGIVRGIAHIGVLQSLTEAGISFDYVAGTSAGALVGAAYAAGLDLDQIKDLALRMRWWHLARLTWPSRGLVTLKPMEQILINAAGDLDFSQLKLPFTTAATDLITGDAIYLQEGKVAPAVHASCVIPGVITPVEWQGHLLGDGSLVNTIPVQPLRDRGAEYVIGVDLFRHKIRRWLGPLGYGLASLEITFSRAGCGYCSADCLISPRLDGKTYLNFWKAPQLIALGRQAAEEFIPAIRSAIGY